MQCVLTAGFIWHHLAPANPSQSFNHPGEMEGAALERLYTKIKDDLVALPEKYSGQLHFPLTFTYSLGKGDILKLWQKQLSALADAKLCQLFPINY